MKSLLKKAIIKIFDPLSFRLGYRMKESISVAADTVAQYRKDSLLENFYSTLKSIPFYPRHIVDVGANHGTWTREALKSFPNCHYTLFEPQAEMRNSIKDILDTNSRVSFNGIGVGKQNGSFKFTIAQRDDSCNFRYSEIEAKEVGLRQIEVPVVTLNDFFRGKDAPVPDIIKIDAEGIDLEVLEGSSDFFGKTEIFMVEAGIVNKVFQNSALTLIQYMDNKGYRLFDITDINRPFQPRVLWLLELVFVKKNGIIDSQKWQ